MVFNTHQKGVVGCFKFREPPQGFDLARKAVLAVKARALIGKIGCVPAQGIAEQAGHLVVEVVAGGKGVKAFVQQYYRHLEQKDFTVE